MSAFRTILDELVEADAAAGAIFVDDSGETVDLSTEEDPEHMRLMAAYAGIYLRQSQRFCSSEGVGSVDSVTVQSDGLALHALKLREGYSLIVVNREPQVSAVSRRRFEAAARKIEEEAFAVVA